MKRMFFKLRNSVEFVGIYIRAKFIKFTKRNDYTRLFRFACKTKNLSAIRFLIKENPELNKQNMEASLLEMACEQGNILFTKELIEKGANVNQKTKDGYSMMDIALKNKNKNLTLLLLDNFAEYRLTDNISNPVIKSILEQPSVEVKTRLCIESMNTNKLRSILLSYYEKVQRNSTKTKKYLEWVRKNVKDIYDEQQAKKMRKVINSFEISELEHFDEIPEKEAIRLLEEAWDCRNMESIKILHRRKIDITKANDMYMEELLEACREGSIESAETLLDKDININEEILALNSKNEVCVITPLIGACLNFKEEFVQYLILKGADINKSCYNVGTPLDVAFKYENVQLIKLLIENFVKIDLDKESKGEHKDIMKDVLNGTSVIVMMRSAIHTKDVQLFGTCLNLLYYALNVEYSGVVSYLDKFVKEIKQEVSEVKDENANQKMSVLIQNFEDKKMGRSKNDLLVNACIERDISGVIYLLEQGALVNPNNSFITPLVAACYIGDTEIIKCLIEAGADVNRTGYFNDTKLKKSVCEGTPLMVATKMKRLNVVECLLSGKSYVEVNKKDFLGNTALFYAVENKDFDIAKELIEKGKADVNIIALGGDTVLIKAVRNNDEVLAKYLIEKGADINYTTNSGTNALKVAIENKNLQLTNLLIDNFVDLDIFDKEKEGKNKEFIESIFKNRNVRFFLRSGDCQGFSEALLLCYKDKSVRYIQSLKEEIK
ncbi:MAG: ankyrin repeat domain-containing protein [Clostridiales bacterium]|nr:ankyrin repeat domain-containing protein [Clostridiales bacterium]